MTLARGENLASGIRGNSNMSRASSDSSSENDPFHRIPLSSRVVNFGPRVVVAVVELAAATVGATHDSSFVALTSSAAAPNTVAETAATASAAFGQSE